jgi:hypothetical protein
VRRVIAGEEGRIGHCSKGGVSVGISLVEAPIPATRHAPVPLVKTFLSSRRTIFSDWLTFWPLIAFCRISIL